MRVVTFVLVLLLPTSAISQSWGWELYLRDDQSASIIETADGPYQLEEAIAAVPKDVWLKYLRIFASDRFPVFQQEIHQYLADHYPVMHQEALGSAGNMHNPKVTALRDAFEEAILATSLVGSINSSLKIRCERITSASFEKFMISKKEDQPHYLALIWLSADECT